MIRKNRKKETLKNHTNEKETHERKIKTGGVEKKLKKEKKEKQEKK